MNIGRREVVGTLLGLCGGLAVYAWNARAEQGEKHDAAQDARATKHETVDADYLDQLHELELHQARQTVELNQLKIDAERAKIERDRRAEEFYRRQGGAR